MFVLNVLTRSGFIPGLEIHIWSRKPTTQGSRIIPKIRFFRRILPNLLRNEFLRANIAGYCVRSLDFLQSPTIRKQIPVNATEKNPHRFNVGNGDQKRLDILWGTSVPNTMVHKMTRLSTSSLNSGFSSIVAPDAGDFCTTFRATAIDQMTL